jgi:hypothetical protein
MILLINIIILISNCSKYNFDFLEVVIYNELDESVFVEKVRATVTCYEENEKQYYLSTPVFLDINSIRLNGPFTFNIEIPAKSKVSIRTKKFNINNEKHDYRIVKEGEKITNIEEHVIEKYYLDSDITFILYYLPKYINLRKYEDYKNNLIESGFISKGYKSYNNIIFIINNKIRIDSSETNK